MFLDHHYTVPDSSRNCQSSVPPPPHLGLHETLIHLSNQYIHVDSKFHSLSFFFCTSEGVSPYHPVLNTWLHIAQHLWTYIIMLASPHHQQGPSLQASHRWLFVPQWILTLYPVCGRCYNLNLTTLLFNLYLIITLQFNYSGHWYCTPNTLSWYTAGGFFDTVFQT